MRRLSLVCIPVTGRSWQLDEVQSNGDERHRAFWEKSSNWELIEAFKCIDKMADRDRTPFEDEVERRSLTPTTKLDTNGASAVFDPRGPKGTAGEFRLSIGMKIVIGVLLITIFGVPLFVWGYMNGKLLPASVTVAMAAAALLYYSNVWRRCVLCRRRNSWCPWDSEEGIFFDRRNYKCRYCGNISRWVHELSGGT